LSNTLKDSGSRREFGTGSVRDVAEGKGRCDLLPLGVLADRLQCKPLRYLQAYIRRGNISSLFFALDEHIGYGLTNWADAMLDVALQFEAGCQKYGDRNWEKGQPLHVYIDSGVRHYLKHLRGDTDEPHGRAFIWNMLCAIWTHINKPELIDLPFASTGEAMQE
jgi:hypothetical protein